MALFDTAPFCQTASQQPGLRAETFHVMDLFSGKHIHADGLI